MIDFIQTMSLDEGMLIGTLAAGVGALFSSFAALRAAAAAATRDAVRMQIFFDFSKRDAAPEMGKATKQLWDFAREGAGVTNISERFIQLKKDNEKRWNEIDDARRIVHKFFLHLMQARQAGLFTDREIIIGTYKQQLQTVLDILKPLENVKEGHECTRPVFNAYKQLYENYDELYERHLGQRPG